MIEERQVLYCLLQTNKIEEGHFKVRKNKTTKLQYIWKLKKQITENLGSLLYM